MLVRRCPCICPCLRVRARGPINPPVTSVSRQAAAGAPARTFPKRRMTRTARRERTRGTGRPTGARPTREKLTMVRSSRLQPSLKNSLDLASSTKIQRLSTFSAQPRGGGEKKGKCKDSAHTVKAPGLPQRGRLLPAPPAGGHAFDVHSKTFKTRPKRVFGARLRNRTGGGGRRQPASCDRPVPGIAAGGLLFTHPLAKRPLSLDPPLGGGRLFTHPLAKRLRASSTVKAAVKSRLSGSWRHGVCPGSLTHARARKTKHTGHNQNAPSEGTSEHRPNRSGPKGARLARHAARLRRGARAPRRAVCGRLRRLIGRTARARLPDGGLTWKGAKWPPSEGMLVTLPEAGSTRMVPSSSWAEAMLTAKFCQGSGAAPFG